MDISDPHNSGVRDITEIGIGLGLAMGHLTGALENSNLFSPYEGREYTENEPDFPVNYMSRKKRPL